MAPRLHVGQEVAACLLTVGILEAWGEVLKGWGGRGRGVIVEGGGCRLTAAWVRCYVGARYRGECNLISPLLSVLFLSVSYLCPFSRIFPFLPFSQAIPYKLDIRFSVYIRPVCINALFLYLSPFCRP